MRTSLVDLVETNHCTSSNRPIYQTFASPFAENETRPVEPEFYIPPCYIVHNVRPVHEQVTSFSDETLFYIFYSMPRDIMQELAAVELCVSTLQRAPFDAFITLLTKHTRTNRMWRYHKIIKQWLTKDSNVEPVRVSSTEERGFYIFFDTTTWQRQRVSLDLSSSLLLLTISKTPFNLWPQREFLLRYEDLEGRLVSITGPALS